MSWTFRMPIVQLLSEPLSPAAIPDGSSEHELLSGPDNSDLCICTQKPNPSCPVHGEAK